MAKKQIPVIGTKENKLIKTLNENLNKNKVSLSQESLENNIKIEGDSELNEYAQEVYDSCGTGIVVPYFDSIVFILLNSIKNLHIYNYLLIFNFFIS